MKILGVIWLILIVIKALALINTSWWIILLWPIPVIIAVILAIVVVIGLFSYATA